MDTYCINRGTLLDNPKVETLKGPDQHTVHCLVDIHSCYTSPFEILVDPTTTLSNSDGMMYSRGWRLNDAGRQAMIDLGRTIGSCKTCGTTSNGLEKGFRAGVKAEVLSLNLEDDLLVPEIKLLENPEVSSADNADTFCQTNFNGMENILTQLTDDEKQLLFTTQNNPSFRNMRLAHGSLMLIGWGLILPSGVVVARFFKHRPDGLWFKIHRYLQPLGLLLTLLGWILALVNFDVFAQTDIRFIHGLVGSIVMVLGLLQPLNAWLRPHLPSNEEEEKTRKRILWEHYHRCAGWSCVFLSVFVIIIGTTMLPQPSDQTAFQITYGVGCIGVLIVLLGYFKLVDSKKEQYAKGEEEENNEDENEDEEGVVKEAESNEKEC